MRNLIRSPLTWMVAAEVAVVGALVFLAWNVVASAGRPGVITPVIQLPAPTDDGTTPLPELPAANSQSQRGPLPGLNTDPYFWRERLAQVNSDQVYLEQLEWRIVRSAEEAVSHYLQTVVLPAIQHAEHAGGRALAA
jgi:hypothetical protein